MSDILTAADPMPFGKHKGVPMGEVPTQYLRWFMKQEWTSDWPAVVEYINVSERLEQEEVVTPLTDDDTMPFGKHKGTKMRDVPASYLDWLLGKDWLHEEWPALEAYILEHESVIAAELEEQGVI